MLFFVIFYYCLLFSVIFCKFLLFSCCSTLCSVMFCYCLLFFSGESPLGKLFFVIFKLEIAISWLILTVNSLTYTQCFVCKYRARAGGPRISWFQNSWFLLFRDLVSGTNFVNSLLFRDFGDIFFLNLIFDFFLPFSLPIFSYLFCMHMYLKLFIFTIST